MLPLLMVKCRDSKSDFSICDRPTSHTKIAAFLKSNDIFSVKQQSLPDIFYLKTRQMCYGTSTLYTLDEKLKILSKKGMTAKKKQLDNILVGFKYSLYNVGNNRFPPIAIHNLSKALQGLLLETANTAYIQFKVSDKKASYKVVMDADIYAFNREADKVDIWTPSGAKTVLKKGDMSLSLVAVKPDQNGIVQINIKGSNVFLKSLLITKETSK